MENEAWERVDTYTEKIGDAIAELAKQLGVASEYVFELLVKQQIADGIISILLFIGVLVLTILLSTKVWNYVRNLDDIDEDVIMVVLGIFIVVLSVIALIQLVFFVPTGIKQIINPEYYAIKEATNLISGLFK